jgi:hypothetical protein
MSLRLVQDWKCFFLMNDGNVSFARKAKATERALVKGWHREFEVLIPAGTVLELERILNSADKDARCFRIQISECPNTSLNKLAVITSKEALNGVEYVGPHEPLPTHSPAAPPPQEMGYDPNEEE